MSLLGLTAVAPNAWAQHRRGHGHHGHRGPHGSTDDEVTERARALYQQGLTFADQGRWPEALDTFQRSLALLPRPSMRFNIGNALFHLGRFREAAAAFEAHLNAPERDDEPSRVTQSRTLMADAREHLVAATLTDVPPGAEVIVDGEPFAGDGATRTLALDPGLRRFEVRAADGRADRFEHTLAVGAPFTHATQLAPAESADPSVAVAVPPLSTAVALEAYARGVEALHARRFDVASAAFREAALAEPTPRTWRWLATTLCNMGRYVESLDAFERYFASPDRESTEAQLREIRIAEAVARRSVARLVVSVQPANATVLVDGVVRAPSPEGIALDPGRHALEARAEGFRAQPEEVNLLAGAQFPWRVVLLPLTGRVVVEPSVLTAAVTIDGAPAGQGRVERELAPGDHVVEIHSPDYEPVRRAVRVSGGGVSRVDITLSAIRRSAWVVPVLVTGGVLLAGGVAASVLWFTRGTQEPLDPQPGGNFTEATHAQ